MKKLLLFAAVAMLATACTKDFFHPEAEALIRDSIYVIPTDAPYTHKPDEGLRFQKEMLRK